MKVFIVLSALAAVALAKPSYLGGHLAAPLAYAAPVTYAKLVPGAPIGLDGRVVDTPEVAVAKAEHTAAHINEKVTLAHEAAKSADVYAYAAPGVVSAYAAPALSAYAAPVAYAKFAHGAPVGVDGRVVDTPEVAVAKAEHAAAHINEKVTLAHEAAKSYSAYAAPAVVSAYSAYSAPVVSAYSAPVVSAYSAHVVPKVYSAAPDVSAYSSYAHPAVSVW